LQSQNTRHLEAASREILKKAFSKVIANPVLHPTASTFLEEQTSINSIRSDNPSISKSILGAS